MKKDKVTAKYEITVTLSTIIIIRKKRERENVLTRYGCFEIACTFQKIKISFM